MPGIYAPRFRGEHPERLAARNAMYIDLLNGAGWSVYGNIVLAHPGDYDAEGDHAFSITRQADAPNFDRKELLERLEIVMPSHLDRFTNDSSGTVRFGLALQAEVTVRHIQSARVLPPALSPQPDVEYIGQAQVTGLGILAVETLIDYGKELAKSFN